jgi:xanthine dehydrogenase accessory factor
MHALKLWKFIYDRLAKSQRVMLLCVVESTGSSPGRQGFKMAVTENEMFGSIGGGIMEHKFVELARERITAGSGQTIVRKQFHQKLAAKDQSGMICSGEQTNLLFLLGKNELPAAAQIVSALEENISGLLTLSPAGISFATGVLPQRNIEFIVQAGDEFSYKEITGFRNHLYIVGGGHCALALSKVMSGMDFWVHLFEERGDINTIVENNFVHEKTIVKDYAALHELIPSGEKYYVVIMTFGYRTDDVAVRALAGKEFRYMGVLGSEAKMDRLFAEWRADGIDGTWLDKIYSPIGLKIKSETPEEIAVSIAAQIIQVKNSKISAA